MTESNGLEHEGEDPRRHPEYDRVFNDYLDQLNLKGFVDPDRVLETYPEVGAAILEDLETYVQIHSEDGGAPLGTLGDYTLRRQIGRGGMGVVYEAWRPSFRGKDQHDTSWT